jgi:1-aminocyclopropane-1-carboxylate deaminase/D-cysteine desulfhydrase-like pyridoxal-dependent ACC family enzyme
MSSSPPDDVGSAPNDTPLLRRFPALSRIARVSLGRYPSTVESLASLSPTLWIKRDDLAGAPMGGNKLRALEYLLGDLSPGERIVTVGSEGSTHALAVATYGAILGARVLVGRWRQEMNAAASLVSQRLSRTADEAPVFRTPVGAYLWAFRKRLRGARWIAAGGSTPLGILGHVNAGLELVEQIDAGELPAPETVVVPLGTGGTAVGLALAFAIAGSPIVVIGARVVPRIVARASHLDRLARRTSALIKRATGVSLPHIRSDRLIIAHDQYGGAYGRETPAARAAADRLRAATGITLDATYSAKALAVALHEAARGPSLFWLTFDSRILDAP